MRILRCIAAKLIGGFVDFRKSKSWPVFPEVNVETWKKSAQKSAPNGDIDSLGWNTPDGIHLKALYTASDIEGLDYIDTLPGFEPFVRGPQATM